MPLNRQIRLKRRPLGLPSLDDFEMVESPVPEPDEGYVLIHNHFVSLDPYMRGRMDALKSYMAPVALGEVMTALTVGEIVLSRDARFHEGDVVLAPGNWQEYSVIAGENRILRRLDPAVAPVTTALGVLGVPAGFSAYVGLLDIGHPKAGETLVVSSAAGAVGSLAGQIGRIKGCRVIGIAGGEAKCRYVVDDLGFDACIDHKSPTFREDLAKRCPDGVDIAFENVGGAVLEAIWPRLNDFARVVLCGLIAQYNDSVPTPGPDFDSVLIKRLTVQGFIITDHRDRMADFLRDVSTWIRDGRVKYREDIVDGLERAPEAFIGMLQGRNFGKLIVRTVGPGPS